MSTRYQIITSHRFALKGVLRARMLHSKHLGIRKPYYVYEPPGLAERKDVPVIYLFRGHEREWVNRQEDASRRRSTAIQDLDQLIHEERLPPMVAVMPGLNTSNNHVPSLGINMEEPLRPPFPGLGSGRFWDFMVEELFPRVARDYPQTAGGQRLAAGFSLGGYTVSLLATHAPGFFDHIGIYDGLLMWPRHEDPRRKPVAPYNDAVLMENPLFDAAFGKPRNRERLDAWNPTDRLMRADEGTLAELRKTTWWMACAAGDGNRGNRDRAQFYRRLLIEKGIPLGFSDVVFHPKAAHTWHWTDRFLVRFLKEMAGPNFPVRTDEQE